MTNEPLPKAVISKFGLTRADFGQHLDEVEFFGAQISYYAATISMCRAQLQFGPPIASLPLYTVINRVVALIRFLCMLLGLDPNKPMQPR